MNMLETELIKSYRNNAKYTTNCYCSHCVKFIPLIQVDMNYPYCPVCSTALRFKPRNKNRHKTLKIEDRKGDS